jgi:hypothetical protein
MTKALLQHTAKSLSTETRRPHCWLYPIALLSFFSLFFVSRLGETAGNNDGVSALEDRPARVVVVDMSTCCSDRAWPDAERRISEELLLSDMSVERIFAVDDLSTPFSLWLGKTVSENNAQAGICIVKAVGAAKATLFVSVIGTNGEQHFQELVIDTRVEETAIEIVVIKAVEAVRSGILLAADNTRKPAAPPHEHSTKKEERKTTIPQVTEKPAPSSSVIVSGAILKPYSRLAIDARFIGEGAPGGIGVLGAMGLSIEGRPLRRIILGADGQVSLLGKDIEDGASKTTFDLAIFRAKIAWVLPELDILHPRLGATLGAAHVWTKGSSLETDDVKKDRITLFHSGVYGELDIALHQRVSIPFSCYVGAIFPQLPIRFNGKSVAELGMPFIEISLALRIHLVLTATVNNGRDLED